MTTSTKNIMLAACTSHKTIEDLLEHITQEPLDKDRLDKKAAALAKKDNMQVDDLDFYGAAILTEISDIIATQFKVSPSDIAILQSFCANGGFLEIDGYSIGDIQEFEYWKSSSCC